MLATQCLVAEEGEDAAGAASRARCRAGVTAKDVVLAVIGKIGTAGGTGYAIEFAGSRDPRALDGRPHDGLQHGDRGGRARRHGRGRRDDDRLPAGPAVRAAGRDVRPGRGLLAHAASRTRTRSSTAWSSSTPRTLKPQVTWGTSPEMVVADRRPGARSRQARRIRSSARRSSARWCTWGSTPNTPMTDIAHRQGLHRLVHQLAHRGPARRRARSCAAGAWRGNVKLAMVVPGSGLVKAQAEKEGLDRIFLDAGFEWREPGCSMCLAMNDDRLEPGERCASTSQPQLRRAARAPAGARTWSARRWPRRRRVAGHFVDVRTGGS